MSELVNVRYEEAPEELTQTAKYLLYPERLESDIAIAETGAMAASNRYKSLRNQYLPQAWDMRVVNGHALYDHQRDYSWSFIEVSEVVDMAAEFAHTVKGPRVAYIRLPEESDLEWLRKDGYEVICWEPESSSWHDEAMKMSAAYMKSGVMSAIFENETQARKAADLWVANGIMPAGITKSQETV